MHITESDLDLDLLLQETSDERAGALVIFGGTVRSHLKGERVHSTGYTAYKPLAERMLADLERETEQRFPIQRCRIVHRLGTLTVGELSVLVIVRAEHRADAFAAAHHAVETLRQSVPIWKQDRFAGDAPEDSLEEPPPHRV
jgi:molybdopterin synthase catalytic subunit